MSLMGKSEKLRVSVLLEQLRLRLKDNILDYKDRMGVDYDYEMEALEIEVDKLIDEAKSILLEYIDLERLNQERELRKEEFFQDKTLDETEYGFEDFFNQCCEKEDWEFPNWGKYF